MRVKYNSTFLKIVIRGLKWLIKYAKLSIRIVFLNLLAKCQYKEKALFLRCRTRHAFMKILGLSPRSIVESWINYFPFKLEKSRRLEGWWVKPGFECVNNILSCLKVRQVLIQTLLLLASTIQALRIYRHFNLITLSRLLNLSSSIALKNVLYIITMETWQASLCFSLSLSQHGITNFFNKFVVQGFSIQSFFGVSDKTRMKRNMSQYVL